jgi:hypothetical protein
MEEKVFKVGDKIKSTSRGFLETKTVLGIEDGWVWFGEYYILGGTQYRNHYNPDFWSLVPPITIEQKLKKFKLNEY